MDIVALYDRHRAIFITLGIYLIALVAAALLFGWIGFFVALAAGSGLCSIGFRVIQIRQLNATRRARQGQ